MEPGQLLHRIEEGTAPTIVDVRTGIEFRRGHIAGAVNAPLWKMVLGAAPLPKDKCAELVVLCEIGPRAAMAKRLLGLFGYRQVTLLAGHMAAWRRLRYPLVK